MILQLIKIEITYNLLLVLSYVEVFDQKSSTPNILTTPLPISKTKTL